ncbi:MAG: DUF2797 domain-containing protein [Bacteroidales bacterium]
MKQKGILRKMHSEQGPVVQYLLPVGTERVDLNACLEKNVSLRYQGEIHCVKCGRSTAKSFAQGYCYPCFTTAPETEDCVLRPELCRAHEGVARDMVYARDHCLIEHVVYLSLTSGLKVGVTRHTQVPTRWIDQGAVRAIVLGRTPDRYTAGLLEVALKDHVPDKTNWRTMLMEEVPGEVDLAGEKKRLAALLPDALKAHVSDDDRITEIRYPVRQYPAKVKSLNLDKDPVIEGRLVGIKGQYLYFDQNRVINIRKYGGYMVEVEWDG